MAEYTKLNSEDSGGISKFLNESIPFVKNSLLPSKFKSTPESDKLELIDYESRASSSNSYFTNKYINSLSIKQKTQENFSTNRARKGNMIMFLYNNNNDPFIVLGPDWFSTLIIIISLSLFIIFYFYFFNNLINPTIKFYGKILSFLHIILYILCFLLNPGIPPKELWIENYFKNRNNSNKNFSYKICRDCKTIMESNENIEHCKICNICIMGMESHNFWIGKCVGKKNKFYYCCFKFLTFILVLYLAFSFVSIPFYKSKKLKNKL